MRDLVSIFEIAERSFRTGRYVSHPGQQEEDVREYQESRKSYPRWTDFIAARALKCLGCGDTIGRGELARMVISPPSHRGVYHLGCSAQP